MGVRGDTTTGQARAGEGVDSVHSTVAACD